MQNYIYVQHCGRSEGALIEIISLYCNFYWACGGNIWSPWWKFPTQFSCSFTPWVRFNRNNWWALTISIESPYDDICMFWSVFSHFFWLTLLNIAKMHSLNRSCWTYWWGEEVGDEECQNFRLVRIPSKLTTWVSLSIQMIGAKKSLQWSRWIALFTHSLRNTGESSCT